MSFTFKQFSVDDSRCAMKVGTDGVLLGAWSPCHGARHIVDAGAGSGLIALMLAQRCDARITAVEMDDDAAACCRANVAKSPWADRITVVNDDVMHWLPSEKVDLLVSNPPFFSETLQSPDAQRARARHSGSFGPNALIDIALNMLSDDGRLAVIIPEAEANDMIYHAEMHRLKVRRECLVYSKPSNQCLRRMLCFERHDGPIVHSQITIRNSDGTYTDQFIKLTHTYYLKY